MSEFQAINFGPADHRFNGLLAERFLRAEKQVAGERRRLSGVITFLHAHEIAQILRGDPDLQLPRPSEDTRDQVAHGVLPQAYRFGATEDDKNFALVVHKGPTMTHFHPTQQTRMVMLSDGYYIYYDPAMPLAPKVRPYYVNDVFDNAPNTRHGFSPWEPEGAVLFGAYTPGPLTTTDDHELQRYLLAGPKTRPSVLPVGEMLIVPRPQG